MLQDTELLQYVYKTADMGCHGIQSILGHTQSASLKDRLNDQQKEYQKLRSQAQNLLETRNESPNGIGVVAKASANFMSTEKL